MRCGRAGSRAGEPLAVGHTRGHGALGCSGDAAWAMRMAGIRSSRMAGTPARQGAGDLRCPACGRAGSQVVYSWPGVRWRETSGGRQGCSLATRIAWQESDRARIAGTLARQGGRRPGCWPLVVGMPVGLELREARSMQLGGTDCWLGIRSIRRLGRSHAGGQEACLASSALIE